MIARIAIVVALVGAAGTVLAASALGLPGRDTLALAGFAGWGAVVGGGVGAGALRLFRRRSIVAQATVVALTSVLALGMGAASAARAMFLSSHDLAALVVVLIAAGTIGALVALVLGHRVGAATRALSAAARRIGERDFGGFSPAGETGRFPVASQTQELSALARELEVMSARLEEAQARERALESSRRELVAWVSHDLRTPLAGIRAMVEALEDGVVSETETVTRYFRTLRQEADRLADLVDDLFELSRINAGALQLHLERVSLGDLVSDAIAAASPMAAAKGVRLEGRLTCVAPELDLSPPEITRVLRNLLENAIRHTPNDGAIWVEAGVQPGHAVVSVADGCGGIPPQDLARVFDPAFRGESARTPEAGDGRPLGAGLGLAIARGIVEAHRGEIWVRNEGVGCRFVVRLPLPDTAPGAGVAPA
ncbi:MAG: sensor histidine kinase [Actinomycetota bacterium]